ncbi:MAG: FG-GAP repeat protein [Planctomycetes bacterium]|nr:FG-GAP repeat protein [Planctomycetota bacterium]
MFINSRNIALYLLVSVCAVTLINSAIWGQCELEKLLASDGEAFDQFGNAVAISGDVVVVGARHDDENGPNTGAAYIYRFNGSTWGEEVKLLASNGGSLDEFGFTVGIDGNAVIVGAPLQGGRGEIYIYRFDGISWIEEESFLNPMNSNGELGFSVAISGDVAIAGAPFDNAGNPGETDAGLARVYRFVGVEWILEDIFNSNAPNPFFHFGLSVDVDGDSAIAGEPGSDAQGTDAGAVHIFRHNGVSWQRVTLFASDSEFFNNFGASVAISGEVVVVGAWGSDDNGSDSGAAYVFRFNGSTWDEEIKLLASDGSPDDNFGFSVGISGDLVIVGSADAAYLFRFDGKSWNEEAILESSDGFENDGFGTAVVIDEGLTAFGARFDNDNGEWSGSAYVFSVDLGAPDCNKNGIPDDCEPDCNGNGIADECDITDQSSDDCNGNGVPDECDVADGFSEDCDGDEVPDDCQVLYFVETSPPLGPIGDGVPQSHTFTAQPEVSPQPGTQVIVTMTASADLGSATEWIDVFLNNQLIGTVFMQTGNDCPDPPDEAQLVLEGEAYALLVADGDAEFQLVASFAVNAELCQDSFVTVQIEYQAVTEDDCNGNNIPDICDILFGGLPDKNGNWIPDECEELCPWDLDSDESVGTSDLLALFAQWGTAGPADFDGSGVVDTSDMLILFANWGPCP